MVFRLSVSLPGIIVMIAFMLTSKAAVRIKVGLGSVVGLGFVFGLVLRLGFNR